MVVQANCSCSSAWILALLQHQQALWKVGCFHLPEQRSLDHLPRGPKHLAPRASQMETVLYSLKEKPHHPPKTEAHQHSWEEQRWLSETGVAEADGAGFLSELSCIPVTLGCSSYSKLLPSSHCCLSVGSPHLMLPAVVKMITARCPS